MIGLFGQITIKSAWKSIFRDIWWEAIGRRWHNTEYYPMRCDFCGRRLSDDFIAMMDGGTVTRICYNHGQYEGQKRIDCFTGCEIEQHKEPRFYHESAILHEVWFFVKAVVVFWKIFFRELPLNILQTAEWIIRKAIKRQQERLRYK